MAAPVDEVAQTEQQPSAHAPVSAPAASDALPKIDDAQGAAKPLEEKSADEKPAAQDAPAPAPATEPAAQPPAPVSEPVATGNRDAEAPKVQEAVNGTSHADAEPNPAALVDETSAAAPALEKKQLENGVDKDATTTAEKPAENPAAAAAPEPAPVAEAPAKVNGDASKDVNMEKAPPAEEKTANVAGDEPVTREKRKAEEPASVKSEVAEKKAKTDDNAEATEATTNGKAAPKKPSRPKKEKNVSVPTGKTLRKTRSQGPVES